MAVVRRHGTVHGRTHGRKLADALCEGRKSAGRLCGWCLCMHGGSHSDAGRNGMVFPVTVLLCESIMFPTIFLYLCATLAHKPNRLLLI